MEARGDLLGKLAALLGSPDPTQLVLWGRVGRKAHRVGLPSSMPPPPPVAAASGAAAAAAGTSTGAGEEGQPVAAEQAGGGSSSRSDERGELSGEPPPKKQHAEGELPVVHRVLVWLRADGAAGQEAASCASFGFVRCRMAADSFQQGHQWLSNPVPSPPLGKQHRLSLPCPAL